MRRSLNLASAARATAMTGLAGWKFASTGFPLAHARPGLAVAAGLLFLLGYPVKALGWRRLFAKASRTFCSPTISRKTAA